MTNQTNKEQLKEFIFRLCAIPSVSGFEKRATEDILAAVDGRLELVSVDNVGNHLFLKRSKKENATRVLIDAHLDEIGMMVTDVLDGGFLKVASIGGIDPAILQAADVMIYGRETLRGVIVSTPPHLKKDDGLTPADEVLIDTGLSKDTAKSLIPLGTPVGFAPVYGELLGDKLMGKSFDDKACAACAMWALFNTPAEELASDVYLLLSSVEETNRMGGGVSAAAFSVKPDYAMVIDVNLARVPDTKDYETVPMGEGPSLSVSAATHIGLTRATEKLCVQKEIPHTMIAAPMSTGTNATSVNLVEYGIPTVDVGLPLASMHTYNEVISLDDCQALVRLVREFICSEEIAEQMDFGEVSFI